MPKQELYRFPRRRQAQEKKKYRKTVDTSTEKERFTGYVEGKTASDLEERFYNVLHEFPQVDIIRFRQVYGGATRTSFGSIELDYLIRAGGQWYAIQIDEEYFHSGAAERERDKQRDARLLEILKRYGVAYINRVESKWLDTIDLTRTTIEEILHGRHYQPG